MPKKKKRKSKKRPSKKIKKKKKVSKRKSKKIKSHKVSKKKKKVRKKTSKNADNKEKEQELIFKTKPEWIKNSLTNKAQYTKKYNDSIKNNNEFWAREGKRITWIKPYSKIKCKIQ